MRGVKAKALRRMARSIGHGDNLLKRPVVAYEELPKGLRYQPMGLGIVPYSATQRVLAPCQRQLYQRLKKAYKGGWM